VRKKRFLWIAVGLVALVAVWFAFLRPRDEPKYQGRYLSEWLDAYRLSFPSVGRISDGTDFQAAESALRAIGTNALPCYLKWIRYAPPAWQKGLRERLPSWIRDNRLVGDWLGNAAEQRARYSYLGFTFLGTNAASAIPDLEVIMKDRTKPKTSLEPIRALSFIGEPALPALQAAFADTNAPNRRYVFQCVWQMAENGYVNATRGILASALNDVDPLVRRDATNAVRQYAPELLIKAPAK